MGFDTETVNGYAVMLCDSDGNIHSVRGLDDALRHLTKEYYRYSTNFFYNLQYDMSAILKYLDHNSLLRVTEYGNYQYKDYLITYIPKKLLSIRHCKKRWDYYDLAQYFHTSLDNAGKKFIGKRKANFDITKYLTMDRFMDNWDDIASYCVQDCIVCKELGVYLQGLFHGIDVSFKNPISQASLSERYFLSHCDIPKISHFAPMRHAYNSYWGGRFEVFKRGCFDNVYSCDIRSAYPYQISKLLNLDMGVWTHELYPPENAEYGFIECLVTLENEDIGVLPWMDRKHNVLLFPQMNKNYTYITLDELKFMENHAIGEIEFISGWYWTPTEKIYPFARISDMYNNRMKLKRKGNPLEYTLKIVMNSLYGKTIQIVKRKRQLKDGEHPYGDHGVLKTLDGNDDYSIEYVTGQLFNPVYASLITSRTRLQLLELMYTNPDSVISCFTDSIFSTKKLSGKSDILGDWDDEGKGEFVILGSGVYSFLTNKGIKTRFRGFTEANKIDLFRELKRYNKGMKVALNRTKVVKIREALIKTKEYSKEEINSFIEYGKECYINFDKKRQWERPFYSCWDVLHGSMGSSTISV